MGIGFMEPRFVGFFRMTVCMHFCFQIVRDVDRLDNFSFFLAGRFLSENKLVAAFNLKQCSLRGRENRRSFCLFKGSADCSGDGWRGRFFASRSAFICLALKLSFFFE